MQTQHVPAEFAQFLAARQNEDFEAVRSTAAGKDLGEEDRAEGVFDDTPPPSIVGDYAGMYRNAYRAANPPKAVAQ